MVETGKEILQNTKDLFYQEVEKRFSNPFLGAFLLAWIFCNWDFLYIVLFLDEQYVSVLPELVEGEYDFFTKYEYIKELGVVTWGKFLLYPLFASFIFIIFVEWVTTYLNEFIKHYKNWILGKREEIDREKYNKLKDDIILVRKDYRERATIQNDEILLLQTKNDELELKIDDKVNERLKEEEKKNMKRIKELEGKLDSTLKISDERLKENNYLINKNKQINQTIDNLAAKDLSYKKEVSNLLKDKNLAIEQFANIQKENSRLKKKLEDINQPIDELLMEEYKEFKNNSHFESFGELIDRVEEDSSDLRNKFYGKYLKYLVLKGILEDDSGAYFFTSKGNKFVEYYLDETFGGEGKKSENDDISVEDLPF